jgi:hypothetical protein
MPGPDQNARFEQYSGKPAGQSVSNACLIASPPRSIYWPGFLAQPYRLLASNSRFEVQRELALRPLNLRTKIGAPANQKRDRTSGIPGFCHLTGIPA